MDLTEATVSGKSRTHSRALLALLVPLVVSLTGCMGARDNAASALMIDPVTTSSVPPLSADSEILSDENLVRDLAGSLEQSRLAGLHPWSNPLTGSAGVISGLEARQEDSGACRRFRTTRHAFDGVSLFDGKICRQAGGSWKTVSFEPAGN
ncbi:RT0821/Lpp0805 family surface protein [Hoeflea sp.]|uniref:RT0821/Lpp0805 family surface protein n=1 Tax=Hoeflea sp. TaxID=1940281 RepID=UPI003B51ACE7